MAPLKCKSWVDSPKGEIHSDSLPSGSAPFCHPTLKLGAESGQSGPGEPRNRGNPGPKVAAQQPPQFLQLQSPIPGTNLRTKTRIDVTKTKT